jgi:hypothetical protein
MSLLSQIKQGTQQETQGTNQQSTAVADQHTHNSTACRPQHPHLLLLLQQLAPAACLLPLKQARQAGLDASHERDRLHVKGPCPCAQYGQV